MRIAVLTCAFPPYRSGISRAAFFQAKFLSELGHYVEVFTLFKESGEESPKFKVHYIKPTVSYGNAGLPFSLWKGLDGFDLIWLHYPFIGAQYLLYFYLLRRNVDLAIYYHHNLSLSGFFGRAINNVEEKFFPLLQKKAKFVFVSSFDYFKSGPFSEFLDGRYHELPLGCDTDFFTPGNDESAANIILFVAALDKAHYFKGLDILLEAAQEALKTVNEFEIRVVGSGQLQPYYENLALRLGLKDRVKFLGSLDDFQLRDEYRRASLLVLPSYNAGEAFGLVLLEAMSCGTPVVCSNMPGLRSVVTSDVGILTEPRDIKALANAIARLLSDNGLRREAGRRARLRVMEKYDLKIHKKLLSDFLG